MIKNATLAAGVALGMAGSMWLGAALSGGGGVAPAPAPLPGGATIIPAVALAAGAAEGLLEVDPSRACVQSFSKDLCEAHLEHGDLRVGACDEYGCVTAYVKGAHLVMNVQHNPQGCWGAGPEGFCDEVPEKDGWLEARVSYTLRIQDPCSLRGIIEGRWQHFTHDGEIYKGTMTGTLGVGTHRAFACRDDTHRQCERCSDVEFLEEEGLWRIGVEATFVGTNGANTLQFSLSGDFYAKGDHSGPFELSGGWRFQGTADGAHIVYCQ